MNELTAYDYVYIFVLVLWKESKTSRQKKFKCLKLDFLKFFEEKFSVFLWRVFIIFYWTFLCLVPIKKSNIVVYGTLLYLFIIFRSSSRKKKNFSALKLLYKNCSIVGNRNNIESMGLCRIYFRLIWKTGDKFSLRNFQLPSCSLNFW